MRKYLSKIGVSAALAVSAVMVFAGSALAAPGDPPTFDAGSLEAPFNDYATLLLAGVAILLGILIVIAAPFTLVKMGVGALKSWVGKAKATGSIR